MLPSPEEALIDSVYRPTLATWMPGKPFLIADNKVSVIYSIYGPDGSRNSVDTLAGMVMKYQGIESVASPTGETFKMIRFALPEGKGYALYPWRNAVKKIDDADGTDLPLVIDLDMVNKLDSLLAGRKVWTRQSLWYDSYGTPIKGTKFTPVAIKAVKPGNAIFPAMVIFSDSLHTASMPMSFSASDSGYETRSFESLFYLSDPKDRYPQILPEIWDLICRGNVAAGMTKDECKLSLGNPKDVDTGHDWNTLIDIWRYTDGSYLMFQDGRLVKFKL